MWGESKPGKPILQNSDCYYLIMKKAVS